MEDIKDILLSRGCPVNQIETISHKIANLSAQLKPAITTWLENESIPVVEIDGYSTDDLMSRFKGMQYPAAILLLDWLLKDPQTAKEAINRGIR